MMLDDVGYLLLEDMERAAVVTNFQQTLAMATRVSASLPAEVTLLLKGGSPGTARTQLGALLCSRSPAPALMLLAAIRRWLHQRYGQHLIHLLHEDELQVLPHLSRYLLHVFLVPLGEEDRL
jgi:hypothetical protein